MNKSLLIAEIATSDEVGKLGLMHLKRYWTKLYLSTNKRCMIPEEPGLDNALLSAAGIGIYQVSKYFYEKQPSFAQFEDWVLALNDGQLDEEKVNRFNSLFSGSADMKRNGPHLYTLNSEDLRFWDENGYLIVRNAVPKEDCKAAVDAICEFLQIDLEDEDTWYLAHKSLQGIMVQLFQHPVLQRNRGSEKVKAVYEQLWNRSDLWVNTDKVGFNPPENDHYKFRGTGLHWDVSLEQPIPFGTQGILYLTDTSSDQGAFTCVPGFHNKIEEWLSSLPAGVNPRQLDLEHFGARPIAAQAGDFIIWHHSLPHGASPNKAPLPRFVQYLNYSPADFKPSKLWI